MVIGAQLPVSGGLELRRVVLSSALPSLVVVKLARLSIVPVAQVVLSVWLKMWTVKLEIGRASCRERVRVWGVVVGLEKKGMAGAGESRREVRQGRGGSRAVVVRQVA